MKSVKYEEYAYPVAFWLMRHLRYMALSVCIMACFFRLLSDSFYTA